MALDDGKFTTDLNTAFSKTDWGECASKLSDAIQAYFKSAAISTTVIAMVTPPPPAVPYVSSAKGKNGKIMVITSSGLTQSIIDALGKGENMEAAEAIGDAVDIFAKGCTVLISEYDAPFTGMGIGPPSSTGLAPIVPIGKDLMNVTLALGFTTSQQWSMLGTFFLNGIKTYIKTCIVNTVDFGFTPPNGWVGIVGIGTIE